MGIAGVRCIMDAIAENKSITSLNLDGKLLQLFFPLKQQRLYVQRITVW